MQRGFNGEFFARKEESARINIKTLMSLYPKTFYHLQGTALTSHMEVNLCACAGEVGGHHASDGADAQNGNTHFNTSLITRQMENNSACLQVSHIVANGSRWR